MHRMLAAADAVLRAAAACALALSGLAMFAQVMARYVFDAPFTWAEEFATLLFSWLIFLGAATVQRTDSHLSVDTLRQWSRPAVRGWLDAFRRLVIIACSVVLLWQGIALSVKMWPLQYPAMEISRSALYLSVTVGAAFTILFALYSLLTRAPPEAPDGLADLHPNDDTSR